MMFKSDSQRRAMFANLFSNASRGKRFERKIHSRLGRSDSIVTMRSSGSRGLWDMIAITPTKVRLVQAKTRGYLSPADREKMLDQLQRMPDNIQAEVEYYVSPHVTKNFTLKKAGEDDWEKVEERLDHFAKVRGYKKPVSEDDDFSRASEMIDKMKGFKSTRNAPAPDFLIDNDNVDLAAVAAGTKPAALVAVDRDNQDQKEIIDKIRRLGMKVEIVKQFDPETGVHLWDDFIVGKPDNVEKLMELEKLKNVYRNSNDMDEFHREYGEALGYNPAAIEDFIKTIKSGRYYAKDLYNYNKDKGYLLE